MRENRTENHENQPKCDPFCKIFAARRSGRERGSKKPKKSTFQCEIYEIALPIIILANYAANAFFHAMEMQDPVRISCADVPVVEKKMDKVRWGLEQVSWYPKMDG